MVDFMTQNISVNSRIVKSRVPKILDKLAAEGFFESLDGQLRGLELRESADLQKMADSICGKVKVEHQYAYTFARLCCALNEGVRSVIRKGSFEPFLVNAVQLSFDQILQPIQIPPKLSSEKQQLEFWLIENKKIKGTVIFIAELYKQRLIAEEVLLEYFDVLLRHKGEAQLEALYDLLSRVGAALSISTYRILFTEKVTSLKQLVQTDSTVSTRMKSLLQSLIEDF